MHRISLSAALVSVLLALPGVSPAQVDGPTGTPGELIIQPAAEAELAAYLWNARVLVVFADTPADPRFIKQMQMIEERPSDLIGRDVVVLTDTAPGESSEARQKLRPRGFALVLIDKDGDVKLRKPSPWHTREIARSIDKTPLRLDEIREKGAPLSQ